MIRVLHLRSGSGLYGADRALLALAGATPRPFQPIVGSVVREGLPDALGEAARAAGLEARTFVSKGRLDLHLVRAVAEEARTGSVSLLHAHDFKTLWLALLAGASSGVPVVATYHGETRVTAAVRAYELFARVLGNFTAGAVAVSRVLQHRLSRFVHLAPTTFIPNAIAAPPAPAEADRRRAREALGLGSGAYVVAVLGRLSPEKGHAILLDALRTMRAPPVALFAGEGPLREILAARARELPVRWLGFVRDPRHVLAAADVICIPSLTEGLPLVALEALAAGRCVVASAVGELPQVLEGGAGVLVPPGDPVALAAALERVREGAARAPFAAAALARSRAYDVQAMAGEYARVYRTALPSSSGALASSSR